ncbi:hypothetical protein HN630_02770 [archaeon]|nr:hypothetical protein [archaeon]MBT6956539.1 hypothetical protein [archaeon]MBT7567803.1 hypothetical protein [archaeon]
MVKKRKSQKSSTSEILANKWFLGTLVLIVVIIAATVVFVVMQDSDSIVQTQGDDTSNAGVSINGSQGSSGSDSDDSSSSSPSDSSSSGPGDSSSSSSAPDSPLSSEVGAVDPEKISEVWKDTDGFVYNDVLYTKILHKEGTCIDSDGYSTDYCEEDSVVEYYLSDGECLNISVDCSEFGGTCSDGACTDGYRDIFYKAGGMCYDPETLIEATSCYNYETVMFPSIVDGLCVFEKKNCMDFAGENYCTVEDGIAFCNESTNLAKSYWTCESMCGAQKWDLLKSWIVPMTPEILDDVDDWAYGEGATAWHIYAYGGDKYKNGGCVCATKELFYSSDSDGGKDYLVKGTCTDALGENNDKCWDNGIIIEYSLVYDTDCSYNKINCTDLGADYVCSDGACVIEGWNSDLECVDINKDLTCDVDEACSDRCGGLSRSTYSEGYCKDYDAHNALTREEVCSGEEYTYVSGGDDNCEGGSICCCD